MCALQKEKAVQEKPQPVVDAAPVERGTGQEKGTPSIDLPHGY